MVVVLTRSLSSAGGAEGGLDEALLPSKGGSKGRRKWWHFSRSAEQDVLARLLDSDQRPARGERGSNQVQSHLQLPVHFIAHGARAQIILKPQPFLFCLRPSQC